MAYTVLINNDNSTIASEKQTIFQNSKLVDTLRFIVPKEYNGYLMSEFSFFIEYRTPISHTVKIETLVLTDDNYKEEFLLYQTDIDTSLTKENGTVEMNLYFTKASVDPDGNNVEQVRKVEPISINIIPIASFFSVTDDALDTIVQMYLQNQKNIAALEQLAGMLSQSKADNIKLDIESGEIYLLSGTKRIGTGIQLEELANEIVETAGKSEGNLRIINI